MPECCNGGEAQSYPSLSDSWSSARCLSYGFHLPIEEV